MIAFLNCEDGTHALWNKVAQSFSLGVREFQFLSAEEFLQRPEDFSGMVHYHYHGKAADAIEECRIKRIPHYWIEGAYVNRHRGKELNQGSWFRITKNRNQAAYRPDLGANNQRRELVFDGVEIHPWRADASGAKILFCRAAQDMLDFDSVAGIWEKDAQDYLNSVWNKTPITFRDRLSPVPLEHELRSASVLFSYNSNAAVDALLHGVPVVVSHESICYPFSRWNTLNLWRGDREYLWNLISWSQFQIREMESGFAWEVLNR